MNTKSRNITRIKKSNHTFPEENTGNISIDGEKIICKGDITFRNCEINIKDIQYVYIVVNAKGESSLFIFDHHQNWLPTNYSGFSETYNTLSAMFKFNDEVFFGNVHKKEQLKKQVWRKMQKPTYEILSQNYNDYQSGFEIQSPQREFINWDTTYEKVGESPNVFFEQSPYGQKILKLKFPVRIGNVLLTDFSAYFDTDRSDVPVQHFFTHCIDKTNTDKSYFDIKARLQKDFLEENQFLQYERADQNSFSFKVKGIGFSLVYTYDSDWQFDGGYTSLNIQNHREYPELLLNSEYENIMEVSSYLIMHESTSLALSYKRDQNVKRRPVNLFPNNNNSPVIWVDNKNSKIGFGDDTYALILDKVEITSLTIQDILPAKGRGGSYLMVDRKDKKNITVFSGNCKVYNWDEISRLTGLDVHVAPEYHDC